MGARAARIGLTAVLCLTFLGGSPAPPAATASSFLEPDLAMAPLSDFRIGYVDGRRMLRFTAMMVNLGPGHFELEGGRSSTSEPMRMEQIIYQTEDRDGPIAQRLPTAAIAQHAGDGHDHWHVMDMMRYDLWGGENAVRGAKVGFCFLDSDRYFGSSASYYRGSWCSTNPGALANRMGISVGWGDLYGWDFAWQWVDITDMPSGTFVLRAMVDPNGWFLESDEGNQCTIAQLSWTADSDVVTFEGQEAVCLNDWNATEFAADIAWAFETGITEGCLFDMFCTYRPVLREQMASFLARARALPPPAGDHFVDDAGSFHEADINRAAEAGITNGCGGPNYCPTEGVTRAQMASFLARAFALPDATTDHFADDAGSIHEADINKIAEAGITLGCDSSGVNYCPDSLVTRGQMAAFLHRAMTD